MNIYIPKLNLFFSLFFLSLCATSPFVFNKEKNHHFNYDSLYGRTSLSFMYVDEHVYLSLSLLMCAFFSFLKMKPVYRRIFPPCSFFVLFCFLLLKEAYLASIHSRLLSYFCYKHQYCYHYCIFSISLFISINKFTQIRSILKKNKKKKKEIIFNTLLYCGRLSQFMIAHRMLYFFFDMLLVLTLIPTNPSSLFSNKEIYCRYFFFSRSKLDYFFDKKKHIFDLIFHNSHYSIELLFFI